MSVAMIYIGGGDWLPGLPARDLTTEEAESHRETLESPAGKALYKPAPPPPTARAAKKVSDDNA